MEESYFSGETELSKCCAILHTASFEIDKRGELILYNSLFLPYIMYRDEILGNK